jgi:shikimate dehydrogenase
MGVTAPAPPFTGRTRLVGVIGWPCAHTLSPRMHNAAYAALGLDMVYVPLPVPPDRVGDAVRGLAGLGFAGANVTVPHKSAVLPYLSELTPIAAALGAANTLTVRRDGSLAGDNTDAHGFMADLRAHAFEPGPETRALVIGAGGAARSVVYGLAEAGAKVAVANRTPERADELCQLIARALPGVAGRLSAHPFPAGLARLARGADLVVNATSLGLHGADDPLPWDPSVSLHAARLVYDLIYGDTPFLRLARAQGAPAVDGMGMLVRQGARAAAIWTGQDEEALAKWMQKELEGR